MTQGFIDYNYSDQICKDGYVMRGCLEEIENLRRMHRDFMQPWLTMCTHAKNCIYCHVHMVNWTKKQIASEPELATHPAFIHFNGVSCVIASGAMFFPPEPGVPPGRTKPRPKRPRKPRKKNW